MQDDFQKVVSYLALHPVKPGQAILCDWNGTLDDPEGDAKRRTFLTDVVLLGDVYKDLARRVRIISATDRQAVERLNFEISNVLASIYPRGEWFIQRGELSALVDEALDVKMVIDDELGQMSRFFYTNVLNLSEDVLIHTDAPDSKEFLDSWVRLTNSEKKDAFSRWALDLS